MDHPSLAARGAADRSRREPIRLLAVGDLVPACDHALLIDVFAQVVRWHPHARLLILGEGPERRVLEAAIVVHQLGERVGLPGAVDPGRLAECLQRTHVLVATAAPDGAGAGRIPPALPAAMASGVCVVASDGPGLRRLVRDGENGLLVEPGRRSPLCRALHLVVGHDGLRDDLGAAAAASLRVPVTRLAS